VLGAVDRQRAVVEVDDAARDREAEAAMPLARFALPTRSAR
jgi:hypothetical protein